MYTLDIHVHVWVFSIDVVLVVYTCKCWYKSHVHVYKCHFVCILLATCDWLGVSDPTVAACVSIHDLQLAVNKVYSICGLYMYMYMYGYWTM